MPLLDRPNLNSRTAHILDSKPHPLLFCQTVSLSPCYFQILLCEQKLQAAEAAGARRHERRGFQYRRGEASRNSLAKGLRPVQQTSSAEIYCSWAGSGL